MKQKTVHIPIKIFWLLVTLTGGYLALLELGMAISEFHALRGTNILSFLVMFGLGVGMFWLGFSRLRSKPVPPEDGPSS